MRGATVVYSTHIFDGLDHWPTHLLHMKEGSVAYVGPIADAPKAVATAGATPESTSGSLFQQVRSWLLAERAERAEAAAHIDVMPTPPTPAPAVAAPAPATAASRFDRFGGGSRQGMYR